VGETAQYIGLRLSPAGSDALVTIRDGENGDLWRVDLTRGARSRITSGGQGWYGSWSPDGQQVAFSSLNGTELLAASARGAGQVDTLLTNRPRVFTSDWSRDGQYLAFTGQTPESSNDVFLLTMKGERKAVPLLDSSFTEFHPQFSPDGGWLAFTSEESGRQDVYVQSLPDGRTRRLVSGGGGSYPRWGRDGRELFYRAADGQLVAVPLRTIGSSVELGSPRVIMRLVDPPAVHPYPYDVAADGRILALTAASDAAQGLALTVRMNWQAALDP
jgi:Tol biopolymer transport system component